MTDTGKTDNFGTPIHVGDTVRILSWGWSVRSMDCGTVGIVEDAARLNLVLRCPGDHPVIRARPEQVGVLTPEGTFARGVRPVS